MSLKLRYKQEFRTVSRDYSAVKNFLDKFSDYNRDKIAPGFINPTIGVLKQIPIVKHLAPILKPVLLTGSKLGTIGYKAITNRAIAGSVVGISLIPRSTIASFRYLVKDVPRKVKTSRKENNKPKSNRKPTEKPQEGRKGKPNPKIPKIQH